MLKFLTIIFLISVIIIPFAVFSDNADFKTGLNNNKLSPPGFGEGVTPDFLEYMGWALKILFFAVIISAVVMIVIGGLEYVIAGSTGNPENIKNAQNRMTMAIGGVVLALASWIILNTINPDLLKTDIKLPGVGGETVRKETTCFDYTTKSDCESNPAKIYPLDSCVWDETKTPKCFSKYLGDKSVYVWQEFVCVGNFQCTGPQNKCVDDNGNNITNKNLCSPAKDSKDVFCCLKVR